MSIRVGMRAMARIMGVADRCPDDVELVAIIAGIGNVCTSVPLIAPTVSLSSAYSVSVLAYELFASPGTTGIFFGRVIAPAFIPAPASTYSLSTAVT